MLAINIILRNNLLYCSDMVKQHHHQHKCTHLQTFTCTACFDTTSTHLIKMADNVKWRWYKLGQNRGPGASIMKICKLGHRGN